MNRKRLNLIIGVLLGLSIIGTPLLKADAAQPSAAATRPDLDYLKAGQSGWAATRPAAAVSAHGAVCQREQARRRRGVFLRPVRGVRATSPGFSKSAVSKRDRLVASATGARRPAVAPN